MGQDAGFDGAKVALFIGDELAVILRDDVAGLSYAGFWDLPGGGREGAETPFECVARECEEELGLRLRMQDVAWSRRFANAVSGKDDVWFFVAHLPESAAANVRFGDEGQQWMLMPVPTFMAHPKVVPAFQERLCVWLGE